MKGDKGGGVLRSLLELPLVQTAVEVTRGGDCDGLKSQAAEVWFISTVAKVVAGVFRKVCYWWEGLLDSGGGRSLDC